LRGTISRSKRGGRLLFEKGHEWGISTNEKIEEEAFSLKGYFFGNEGGILPQGVKIDMAIAFLLRAIQPKNVFWGGKMSQEGDHAKRTWAVFCWKRRTEGVEAGKG